MQTKQTSRPLVKEVTVYVGTRQELEERRQWLVTVAAYLALRKEPRRRAW